MKRRYMTRDDYYWQEIEIEQNAIAEATMEAFEEEQEDRRQLTALYQPRHQAIYSPDTMPETPVRPIDLVAEVTTILTSMGVTISSDTPKMIEDICKVFNFIIHINIQKAEKSFVYPAQTGSGKSLSLQVYTSMLKEHSSLIIVAKVSEAIKYCQFINEKSNDPNYARCYYAISLENPLNPLRAMRKQLKEHRCIIVTHSMFRQINKKIDVDTFKLYGDKQRDFIAIDESLSFYEEFRVTKYELDALIKAGFTMIANSNYLENIDFNFGEFLTKLQFLCELLSLRISRKSLPFTLVAKQDTALLAQFDDIVQVLQIVEIRKAEIVHELELLGIKESTSIQESIGYKIKDTLENLKGILEDNFYYFEHKKQKALVRINNIVNKLGANVILDAAATVNKFYAIANRYGGFLNHITVSQRRKYSNLTIHKAIGFSQSRSHIYKGISKENTELNASMYASFAYSILDSAEDKLLIICHKGFKPLLQLKCNDPRICFTHWGDHVGKNNWSHCNKVMVVGWNFLNSIDHLNSMVNAVGELDVAMGTINMNELTRFEYGQLADDLVQAVMRSKARIIATEDSDCSLTDIYLFYKETALYRNVLDIFHSQFPHSKIVSWAPVGIQPPQQKTSLQNNIDIVIEHLKSKKETHHEIDQSIIIKETGIAKQTFGRLTKKEEFKKALEKQGFALIPKNGKSKKFILN